MKRVLFVDDEPNILAALSRMLRSKRGSWDTHFCSSGAEALVTLEQSAFDVIVSDIRMPGMDGVALLKEVKERYPAVTRLALSGYAEQELMLESVAAVHRFLTKPTNVDDLTDAIECATDLQQLLENDELVRVVGGIDSLPSLPEIYTSLMEELRAPEPDLARVGEIVESDVAMTAKLLQVINSAFFGLPVEVPSVKHAVSLLGVDVVRGLVLSTSVFSELDTAAASPRVGAIWGHCARVGALARKLAKRARAAPRTRDLSYMAGLVHDIGQLVIMTRLPESQRAIDERIESEGLADWEAERAELGATHMEVGAYLLALWGLPSPIVEAVAHHHCPSRSPGTEPSALTFVHVATAIVEKADARDGHTSPLDETYVARVGMAESFADWESLEQPDSAALGAAV